MHKEPHLRLNALIRRFSSGSEAVIVGVYGTHVHSDSFKMYYDEKGNFAAQYLSDSELNCNSLN